MFVAHRESWNDLSCEHKSNQTYDTFNYGSTPDPVTSKTQYLMAMVQALCITMVEELLDTLSLEVVLSVSVEIKLSCRTYFDPPCTKELGYTTILDAFGAYCSSYNSASYHLLLDKLEARMDPSRLLLFYLGAHYHERVCREYCIIVRLLQNNADANPQCCLLTPLQIAVRNWDLAGVRALLEYGANPNGLGQPGGYVPTHMDTTWARSSPLHILRNAEYGFLTMEFWLGLKNFRTWQWPAIEALLLEHGAKDFIQSGPVEERPRVLQIQSLLN
ncbi:hypothetical protein K458DRAFT_156680 [Lentithecium fluviatile CBS 122367]|uniref:Uncharacterized protein n=1 Tax=Lentithecium fluviatile CBS 122367 TaxID=1168545 RepID=A0A6G1IHM5_9PLEO|nr:hypothetical protein K458DRAFT_156680 [Lentithecium fluviatile CBS 122367]